MRAICYACGEPPRDPRAAYCSACWRLVPPDHREHLRMTHRSPMWSPASLANAEGVNVMWVREFDGSAQAVRHPADAANALAWLEMRLALHAVGLEVAKVRRRKAARARALERRAAAR